MIRKTNSVSLNHKVPEFSCQEIIKNANSAKHKKQTFWQRIRYAIIPFFIFVAVLMITYFGNQLLGQEGSNYPYLEVDDQIPLISWFIYFYYLTFPFGIIAFFYLAYSNRKSFYDIFVTLCISFLISGVIYLFAQSSMAGMKELEPTNFTEQLVVWTWGSTNPINCFPSQHTFMAIAIIIAALTGGKDMKWWFKLLSVFIATMIILSTVFTRQHYLLDLFASFDIMVIVYIAVRLCDTGKKMDRRFCKRFSFKNT